MGSVIFLVTTSTCKDEKYIHGFIGLTMSIISDKLDKYVQDHLHPDRRGSHVGHLLPVAGVPEVCQAHGSDHGVERHLRGWQVQFFLKTIY